MSRPLPTPAEAAERVAAARKYAHGQGLIYLPAFEKQADGTYLGTPLEGIEAIKLLQRHRVIPSYTAVAWWLGKSLGVLKLSFCVHCRCYPVANAEGSCWRCETMPWECAA